MRDKRIALIVAGLFPTIALVVILASANAMAAPSPTALRASNLQYPIPNTQFPICLYRDRALECVSRSSVQSIGSPQDQARALIQSLVDGPSTSERASGLRSALPEGSQLADVGILGDDVTIKLILPEAFLYGQFNALVSDEIVEQIVKTLHAVPGVKKFHILALDPRDASGAFRPFSYFLFEPPAAHKENLTTAPTGRVQPAVSVASKQGALVGKAVYMSAGHGWYWSSTLQDWRTQRPAYNEIIEDMNNAEVTNQYLLQYLRNAGAEVWPVREQDMNTQEIIVTHNQPEYSDTGTWVTSLSNGYQGQPYRYAVVSSRATATATWTFTASTTGRYAVYAWYYPSDNRAPDAQYLVTHDGGVTQVRIDQRVHGFAWRYIGTFPFAANVPGRVMLTNQSVFTQAAVIADAIRVGGGVGTETGDGPPTSPGTSGKPRWEEAARYWAKYQGAPASVYSPCAPQYGDDCDDVTARPLYAEWERSSSEDAVFVSWHTNGGGGRGTESYIYDGAQGGTFTPGSDRLQHWIQSTLVSDIRAGWETGWTDRGELQADFGEVRALDTMPGTLVEIAFHDQQQDAEALQDPRFAQLTARAMYKGILRFFAEKDHSTLAVLPEPPRNLYVRNDGVGQVTISWKPSPTDTAGVLGDAATGYRVYTSGDGAGWGDGVVVTGTSFTLTGQTPGQLIFVRVSATNDGGESFPTPVGAARVALTGLAPVLVVNGYERIDRFMDVVRCDTPEANCPNLRIQPARMNDQSYVIQHATAIALPFDSAVRSAYASSDVAPLAYDIVDWLAGQEQTPASIPNGTTEVALTPAERALLAAFLNHGRSVFLSGAEVAFDLNQTGGLSFLTGTLRAQYAADDAGSFSVSPSVSGILSGLLPFSFDDGSHGTYAVNYPDVLTPTNGSKTSLNYVGGAGGAAAVEYANGCQRLVYLGFPFETIYPLQTRQAVMARVLSYLGACINQPPSVVILSPESQFYNRVPPIHGIASGSPPVDHVDVAVVQITAPHTPTLLFLNGTSWVTSETWLSATGNATWAYTPSVALEDGRYAVWARAWNSASVSSTQTTIVSFTLDTVVPTAPVPITPTGGITLPALSATLVFSPGLDANGVAGYTVRVDGDLYTTTATFFPVSALSVGTHTWAVRAFDAAGNASAWMTATFATKVLSVYLPAILRGASPYSLPLTNCQELLANGGFETLNAWYSLNLPAAQPKHVTFPVHSGSASLLMGYTTTMGAPPLLYSSIQQAITVPPTAAKTTCTFWRYPVSGDARGDFQYLAVGPTPTDVSIVWRMKSNERAWTPTTIDLSAYTGTLTIRFGVYNDGQNDVTAAYLDDVSVQSCSP